MQGSKGLVIGGEEVKDRDYPWAGAFFYRDNFFCGGSLSK
jgi:hypothetical protein